MEKEAPQSMPHLWSVYSLVIQLLIIYASVLKMYGLDFISFVLKMENKVWFTGINIFIKLQNVYKVRNLNINQRAYERSH